MRLIASRMLLGAGIVTLGVCIVSAVNVGESYQRAVIKDDFAGFSLGVFFLLHDLVPLTLSLFVAAVLLSPPAWLIRRLGIRASASRSFLTTSAVVLCLAGAAAILLYVVTFVARNMVHTARHYGYRVRGLAMVLLQNLLISSPPLILSVLLGYAGRTLTSRPRPLDDD